MTKGTVLVIDDIHPIIISELEDMGYSVVHKRHFSREGVLAEIEKYVGLIVRSRLNIDRELIDQGKKLQFVGRTGSGMELIDTEYAASKNIACINSPEGNRDAVAEHAIGMMLSLNHNIAKANREMRLEKWKRQENVGNELGHKVVGLIGMGNTGMAVAKRLSCFGCRILGYDKMKSGFGNDKIEEVTLEMISSLADVVSLHIPLTEESHHFCNDEFINGFAKPIILVNTARGPVASIEAIEKGLKNGKIEAVGLDVFESEPIELLDKVKQESYRYIAQHPRAILTPHVAGLTDESFYKVAYVLAQKLRRII